MKQNKGGRPPTGRPTGRKVTVYLLPHVEEKARQIGRGNLSGGVAEAVSGYPYKRTRTVVVGSRDPAEMTVTEWGRATDSGTASKEKKGG
jgi:hypothetical protein